MILVFAYNYVSFLLIAVLMLMIHYVILSLIATVISLRSKPSLPKRRYVGEFNVVPLLWYNKLYLVTGIWYNCISKQRN